MNVVTRGIRNAFRNQIRTFSVVVILGLSVGLALTMLIARQAVGQKISSIQSSVGNTVSISPAGSRGFEGGGNPLTGEQITSITKLPHVTGVTQTLEDRLTTSNSSLQSAVDIGALGRRFAQNNGVGFSGGGPAGFEGGGGITRTFTPPVTVVGTTAPTDLSSGRGGGTFTLKSGAVFNSSSSDNVALLGSTLADKNNLKVGSTFTAYNATITVVGTFDSGNAFSNNQVIMPLATIQKLSGQPDTLTGATANVDSIVNIDSVTADVTKTLGSAADVTNSATQAKQTIAPLQNIQTISLYSLIGAVIGGAVIILLTMIMIVRERRREIGVIKAIGSSNAKVVFQFMTEAVTLTTLGAVIGIVFGVLAANPITRLLVNNSNNTAAAAPFGGGRGIRRLGLGNSLSTIHATVGWSIILYGLAASIIIAVVGSGIAALFIAKVRPAEVMRAE